MKFLFLPFSIAAGFIAGTLSKKIFEGIWGLVDREEAPDAEYKEVSIAKLVLALVLEDHEARRGFYKLTGRWPGEEAPEPEHA
jgi:hypothetical protein